MIEALLGDEAFHGMMKKHTHEIVELLLKKGVHFSILTNVSDVNFDPELPENITQGFKPITMFFLAGYTFESAQIYNDTLSFEAGFGNENFGSVVKIPLHSIFQIIVDESILYINSVATVDKFNKDLKKNSFNVFKNNPNNKKFN